MRLIDADALHKLFGAVTTDLLSKPELSKDFEHMVRAFIMTTEMIEDQPTVDAIPIEWILNNERMPKNGKGRKVIIDMLEDWRKEHEAD